MFAKSPKQTFRKHLLLLLASVLFLVATSVCSSSLQQYFEVQPEAQYLVQTGQEIRLRCLIRNRQGECVWLRNGRVVGPIARKYSFSKTPDDGDCSLLVRNTSVSLDDGHWQCQVLSAELDQEPLQSGDVHLLVLVPPERPQVKNLVQGSKLILEEKKEKIITCEMRGGNPAPRIEWYLDGKNITKEAQMASSTGVPNSATSTQARVTQSKLKLADIKRSMNGKNLTCVGVHQTLNQSTSVELDVQYLPTVSVIQREYSIVEGSPLSINCQVDSNPPPSLVNWRLVSDGSSLRQKSTTSNDKEALVANKMGPVLEFERIGREYNQNTFECLAQNTYGVSMPTEVKLNVLYAPYLVNTSHSESTQVGKDARLTCQFEGNPTPEIKWFYTDPMSKSALAHIIDTSALAGADKQHLLIRNSTYRNEGDYHCEARNTINGQTYAVRSSNIILDIYGEPQFLAKSPVQAKVVQGTKSDISLTFCSDPPPYKVYWQYGSIRIEVSRVLNLSTGAIQMLNSAGSTGALMTPMQLAPPSVQGNNPKLQQQQQQQQHGLASRFIAHPLQPLQRRESHYSKSPSCFESALTLVEPELNDQREYQLMVINESGHASGSVRLKVASPLSPVLMISSAFVTIFGLFLCSLLFMFVFKRRQQFMSSSSSSSGRNSRGSSHANGGTNATTSATTLNDSIKASDEDQSIKSNGYTNGNHHFASQTKGLVNGSGNGLANGASNPGHHHLIGNNGEQQVAKQLGGANLLSMASSDTSCNDQKQLISSNGSDRTTSSGGPNAITAAAAAAQNEAFHASDHHHQQLSSPSGSNRSSSESGRSTPTIQMNHISVDDELQLNGTYQATEPVTRGAHLTNNTGQALIYANIDYGEQFALAHHLTSGHQSFNSPVGSIRAASNVKNLSPAAMQHNQITPDTSSPPVSIHRSNVGATIAMMNSLAAAAVNQQQQQQPSPGQGAINQQLNARAHLRKPGPPKPPKPSIQQRSRFYQQQQQQQHLVMIGSPQSMTNNTDEQTISDFSRLAFPARAEL